MRGARHANPLAEHIDGLQSNPVRHRASTGVVADNDHHDQRIAQLNDEIG